MTLTKPAAEQALAEALTAERHSRELRGYEVASPHLMLWGAIYAAAYGWGFFVPSQAGLVWSIAAPLGLAGSFAIGGRQPAKANAARNYLTFVAIYAVLIAATAIIMRPREPNQMAAFVPLLIAGTYVGCGLYAGARLIVLGTALAALTLFGFFALPAHFLLWMAVVGGGALFLGGLWLRRA